MIIRTYDEREEDGEQVLRFQINSEHYAVVLQRLLDGGFNPGGQESAGDGQGEIVIAGRTIEEVNEAIADIPGEP